MPDLEKRNMDTNKRHLKQIILLLFIVLFGHNLKVVYGNSFTNNPDLTTKQLKDLYTFSVDFYKEHILLTSKLEATLISINRDIFLTGQNETIGNRPLQPLVQEASGFYREIIKLKVNYAIKGKELLPDKTHDKSLINILQFEIFCFVPYLISGSQYK